MFHATDFIAQKRDKRTHTLRDIRRWFSMITTGEVQDDQIAAWLMAVYLNGLEEEELFAITDAMIHSGDTIDLSKIDGIVVDKHSTGGVADTTTLITGPIVASLGIPFAKMSGRGLGHTGGTLDKLASIPGFRTDLSDDEFIRQVNRIGIAITGQTKELVPADGKLYALRDVTATIDSIPLIASSIMSKKLAVGADKIVLDVKVGSGAFMKNVNKATLLARTMTKIGAHFNKETVCLITDMDEPLGKSIGNALEVYEALDVLYGNRTGRLLEVSIALAAEEILLTHNAKHQKEAEKLAIRQIENGQAVNKLKKMVELQGGDTSFIDDPENLLQTKNRIEVYAEDSGIIQHIDALGVGKAALELGCGRYRKNDIIDLYSGIHLLKQSGEEVKKGEPVAVVNYNLEEKARRAAEILKKSIIIGEEPRQRPLIYAHVTADTVKNGEAYVNKCL